MAASISRGTKIGFIGAFLLCTVIGSQSYLGVGFGAIMGGVAGFVKQVRQEHKRDPYHIDYISGGF